MEVVTFCTDFSLGGNFEGSSDAVMTILRGNAPIFNVDSNFSISFIII